MGKAFFCAAVVLALAGSATADYIDQQNPVQNGGNGWSYLNPQFEGSQSFTPSASNISGAGIYLGDFWGDGDVTLGIYTTDPYTDGGANPVPGASGTAFGTHGNWVDIFWSPVAIIPNQTYYLALTGTSNGGVTTYTTGNAYGGGNMHYYGSTEQDYDFVFQTWAVIPAPGAAGLIGLGALAATRRRRA